MCNSRHRPGVTLLEVVVVCTLLGIAAGASLPLAHSALDRLAVVSARDQITAAAARSRTLAVSRGGATLIVDAANNAVWIEIGGQPLELPTDFTTEFGVTLSIDGSQQVAEIAFDALGIGRVASRTIRITRGDAEARLTISAFGRLRAS